MSLQHIAEVVKGRLFLNCDSQPFIQDFLLDSRKLGNPENTLFIAIHTDKRDGHQYISELIKKGVCNFLISDLKFIPKNTTANFVIVDDTLKALQKLAATHRKQFEYPVIGISGSNGKTIVKEWLFQLLRKQYRLIRSPKSYNSQIGVPLSVLQMTPQHQLAIFEAGISETGEMEKLQKIIQPDIGLITNIGEAHAENFINNNQKAGEKLKLFRHCKALVYNMDSAIIHETVIRSELHKKTKTFTWSKKHEADLMIQSIENIPNGKKINAIYQSEKKAITIPFIDEASIENAIHCWAMMLLLGYDHQSIAPVMLKLHKVAMRLELKEGINHCTLINDAYNSDINSLVIALDFLQQQNQHKKKTIILSDVLQSGKSDLYLYDKIAKLLEQKGVEKVIGIGKSISKHAKNFSIEKYFYPTTSDFLKNHLFSEFQNESILIKGARIFGFENISKALQQKDHQTVMEINLNALVHNLNYYRGKIKEGTKIMAMVKAFSYGTGSFEIANVLQFHLVDYLAVAYADEGVALRKRGINLPIMVMNPDENSFDAIIQHDLEPEIYSFAALRKLEKAIHRKHIDENKIVNIHLKADTGMHRLGFMQAEIPELIKEIKTNKRLHVQSVFSHLAASDDPQHDDFSKEQISVLNKIADQVEKGLSYKVLRHILNSAGIDRFPDAQMNMVRLGISLYGISSIPDQQKQLENVSCLKTVISQIKSVEKGKSIGYNRSWIAREKMKIAIVPIGYADGLRRSLGNGKGQLQIGDEKASIVGDVCMDMCMLDVTGLSANEGDEVIVFGKDHAIQQLAKAMNTIPYEVLAGISQRVKRVYYYE